jgi:saccharopine dehydrogenase (NAD+, L-lysine-forming)
MGKALIIGAGGVASVVVHKCCQNPEVFEEICIASRTVEKCDALKNKLAGGHTKIQTAQLDADNTDMVIELIKSFKPDIVINVALPYQDLSIMDACLATGVHYIDTANYEPPDTPKFEYKWQWAYKEKFERAGITALLGSGFDPGVTGVFVHMLKSTILMKLIILISWMQTQVIMGIRLLQTLILKSISVK